jgi:hypothetical protein
LYDSLKDPKRASETRIKNDQLG